MGIGMVAVMVMQVLQSFFCVSVCGQQGVVREPRGALTMPCRRLSARPPARAAPLAYATPLYV